MKTIILFASKYGAAGEIARRIASRIKDATVHELKRGGNPSLDGFDCVILGSSVYAGMIRKEAKTFLSLNAAALQKKKLGLFLSGMETSGGNKFFETNFPRDILETAKATGFLGGIFDPKKAGLMERLIMKAVAKTSAYGNTIDDEKIEQFVESMKA